MATQTEERGGAQPEGKLQRDVSTVGLLFFSLGSIIGSGWLFGSLYAAQVAGPAAIISWVGGGLVMIILALVHAELGAMYPVAGGSARYPHFAFGSLAGFLIGWIVWIGSVTVAPIEVLAVTTYLVQWFPWMMVSQGGTEVLTGLGIVFSIVLMGVFTIINLLGVGSLAKSNNVIMIWKVAVPFLAVIVLIIASFNGSNFTSEQGGFAPFGITGILSARGCGSPLRAVWPARRGDPQPRAQHPAGRHRIDDNRGHFVHRVAVRFHWRDSSLRAQGWMGGNFVPARRRPLRRDCDRGRRRLACDDRLHRRHGLPWRDRPHLHRGELATVIRARPQPLHPAPGRLSHPGGRPDREHHRQLHNRVHRFLAVPGMVGARQFHRLGDRDGVCDGATRTGRHEAPGARPPAPFQTAGRRGDRGRSLRHSEPDHLLERLGRPLEALHRDRRRLRAPRHRPHSQPVGVSSETRLAGWFMVVAVLYRAGDTLLPEPDRLRRHGATPVRHRYHSRGGLQHRHLLLRHVGAPYTRRGAGPCSRRERRVRGGRRARGLTLAGGGPGTCPWPSCKLSAVSFQPRRTSR